MSNLRFCSLATVLCLIVTTARAEIQTGFLMDTNPDCLPKPSLKLDMQQHRQLWFSTLTRPEVDLQRMAAETITLANEKDVPGLLEAVPYLKSIVAAESTHFSARFAAARALISLDSRESADTLFQAARKYGADLRQLVEPALAKWDFGPVKSIWIKRLDEPGVRPRDFMLATRGLGIVRETAALPRLKAIVLDLNQPSDIRLESAAAAGQLAENGLGSDAEQLIHETRTNRKANCHCAIRLLVRHSDDDSRGILNELVADPEPSIVAAALERLNGIDSALVLPHSEKAMKSVDVNVRHQGAIAYVRLPTVERMAPLGRLLDDPNPELRKRICDDLNRISENTELNGPIRSVAVEVLNGTRWQGQEQAVRLLGQLEHQPAAGRFVELLESDRAEVSIIAAWGLRQLANPETTNPILGKIERQSVARRILNSEKLDLQVAYLFEACGRIRAREAIPLIRQYIPKDLIMGERSRAAAVWALGWIHEGMPDNSLGKLLLERINDPSIMPPESLLLKRQAIITLGRMKAVDFAADLRIPVANGTPNDPVSLARVWAIKELTGEELPGPRPGSTGYGAWFLEPVIPAKK